MTPIRLDGQVVLVTGSGRGLGASHARAVAARGAQVVVHDAGVAFDGTGGSRDVADSVVSELAATGGTAVACYENLESEDGCGKMAHFPLMLVIAAEGRAHGILANAISPAAATRMLRREVEPCELDPEQVSPAVVFLVSERCTLSGTVLECAGGRFAVARWTSSDEVDLGREPVDPEVLEERWAEIEGTAA